MTAFVKFLEDIEKNLILRIYERRNEAEKYRNQEYSASVRIQSWYRGIRSRFYLKFINNAATTIQRFWKGHSARNYYEKAIGSFFLETCKGYYSKMATKIQKIWRGYWSRKKQFDFYKRKSYLENVCHKNELILDKLDRFSREQEEMEASFAQAMKEFKKSQKSFRSPNLHLREMSTGTNMAYSTSNQSEIYIQEEHLQIHFDKRNWYSCQNTLPPLPQKPQGPFRDPRIVQLQRYKPLRPTLRVETSFDSFVKAQKESKVEEHRRRLHDNHFISVKKPPTKYQPLLQTKSEYGHTSYGVKYFRESNHKSFITDKDFKTFISNSSCV